MITKRNEESVKEEDGLQADHRQTQQTERTPGKEAPRESRERGRVKKEANFHSGKRNHITNRRRGQEKRTVSLKEAGKRKRESMHSQWQAEAVWEGDT